MTIKTGHFLPVLPDIPGVFECKPLRGPFQGPGWSLLDNAVANVAIIPDDSAFFGFVPSIMTAEAPRKDPVPDIIRIFFQGDIHVIPNGQIKLVTNFTHGWSNVLITIPVPYEENTSRVLELLKKIGEEFIG